MKKIDWLLVMSIGCIVLGVANIALAVVWGHWWNWLIGGWACAWGTANLVHR